MQVSMDGPNVNWSFLKMFNAYLQTNCDEKTLINLGSCGLHVVHGSLKTGHSAAKWSVHQILRSMYNLFKASPARRSDLCAIKPNTKFPLKFCKVRWCGNTPACTCAIEVYDDVKTFLETKKLPSTYTVKTLKSGYEDTPSLPKIMFLSSVSSAVEPFLKKFQCTKPMAPFLVGEVLTLLYALFSRLIKDELAKANSYLKVYKLDPNDSKLWLPLDKVDIGVAAEKLVRRGVAKKIISEGQRQTFQKECTQFLSSMISKLLKRCPLKWCTLFHVWYLAV